MDAVIVIDNDLVHTSDVVKAKLKTMRIKRIISTFYPNLYIIQY